MATGHTEYPLEIARDVAQQFVADVSDVIKRIDICGSIRRRKSHVKDIEIVCEPLFEPRQRDLFGNESDIARISRLNARLTDMVAIGNPSPLQIYRSIDGRTTLGERYRRYVYRGVPIDLFIVDPLSGQDYGAIQAIRTGSADFIRRVVTPRSEGGCMPSYLRQSGGQLEILSAEGVWCSYPFPIDSEKDWFQAVGVPWLPPERRHASVLDTLDLIPRKG